MVLNARLAEPETILTEVAIDTDNGRCRYRYCGNLDHDGRPFAAWPATPLR